MATAFWISSAADVEKPRESAEKSGVTGLLMSTTVLPVRSPANALGIRRIMFAVDDIDDVVARLRSLGAELVGVIAIQEHLPALFLRGPEGIIIGLAEQLS